MGDANYVSTVSVKVNANNHQKHTEAVAHTTHLK